MKRFAFLAVLLAGLLAANSLHASITPWAGRYNGPHVSFRLGPNGVFPIFHIVVPHHTITTHNFVRLDGYKIRFASVAANGTLHCLIEGEWVNPARCDGTCVVTIRTPSGRNVFEGHWYAAWTFF